MTLSARGNKQEQRRTGNGCVVAGSKVVSPGEGVYAVCKPEGVSSFRMVQQVRRLLGIRKVGHSGTLDPFASGVLVLCAGRPATRLIPSLMEGDKEYVAMLQLGIVTETQDPEGRILARRPVGALSPHDIAECLARFTGQQLQTPPAYSALKHKGKPLYHYARKGIKVKKEPRLIIIRELQCLMLGTETLTLRVVCSKGTYIRTLAADIGDCLGCGAHLSRLQRTRNGFFTLAQTVSGEKLFTEEGRALLESSRLSVAAVKQLLAGTGENN